MPKDQILPGEKCPDCGKQLYYDPGEWGGWDDPTLPDSIYCPHCGFDRVPNEKDYINLGFENA